MQDTTKGFHHIALGVRDVGRAARFYGDLLGLTLAGHERVAVAAAVGTDATEGAGGMHASDATHGAQDVVHYGVDAQPGTLVALHALSPDVRGRWGIGGVHHLALGTRDRATQLMWKRRLQDADVPVSGPFDRGWFHSIYFADPDGQVVEIATAGPGYALDEPADRLGELDIMPSASRLRGRRDERAIALLTHDEPVPAITDAMRLDGLHHITGFTDDIVRADEFFDAALGLRLIKRTYNQDDPQTKHWFWARYDGAHVAPHSALTLFGWPGSDYRARPGVGQAVHVAYRVADDAALAAARAHLLELGVAAGDVVDRGAFRTVTFAAPDGFPLALATDVPGFHTSDARAGSTARGEDRS